MISVTPLEQPILRDVGTDTAVWFLTNRMTFLVNPEETRNAYSLVHTVTQSNGAPPPHIHAREDEVFYMIRGTGKFLVKDKAFEGGPGSITYLPRGLAHSPILLSDDAEVLILSAPGEYSNFFKRQSIPATAPGLPTLTQAHMPMMEEILSVGREFGVSFLPPGAAVSSWPVPEVHGEPKHLLAGEGEVLDFLGCNVTVKLEGGDTQALFSLFEIEDHSGFELPIHTSHVASEGYYVLQGHYEFRVGDHVRQVGPGSFTYVPAHVSSGYKNLGPGPGKLLLITAESGHEDFFRDPHPHQRGIDMG